ncbi:histidine phosphatase family protein [Enemella sp. A6]|uniref:histidine phosphatase family protein n=1 Tax=Enemella sp. A6 TaxID=3440152 RepID=UPI003EC064B0
MRLLLIRHAQTTANRDRILDTAAPGHSLTDLGHEQAEELARRPEVQQIGALVVSNLVRTQQTAAPLVARLGLTPEINADGREIFAGDLEDATEPDAHHQYAQTVFSWVDGDRSVRLANGESGEEVLARFDRQVDRAVAAARQAGSDVAAVIAHGAILRMWTGCRADGADASFIASHPLENTGIIELAGDPESGWRLVSYAGLTAERIADGIDDSLATEMARDEREENFGG